MKHRLHIFSFVLAALLCSASVWATINNNTPSTSDYLKNTYYNGANGKSGSALFTALTTISEGVHYSYNKLTYDNLWTAYATSDVYPTGHEHAGKIWDMYATCYYNTSDHASTNGGPECSDGINREHSMPKSWWGNSGDAYKSNNQGCDLVHVVPTDAYVNKVRDNYAFGEVQTATYTFAISKQGTSKTTLSLTSGSTVAGTSVSVSSGTTVFEPADEYKGDFARIYMYMRARYPSLNLAQQAGGALHFTTTTSAASDTYYGLKAYSVILLMKWHRQDPVSQKEIDRNNAIEKMQGNRNPFVDYPCLAEYLWGKNAGETFLLSNAVGSFEDSFVVGSSDGCACSTDPTITSPTGTVNIGTTNTSNSIYKDVTVQGTNLESGSLTLTIGGTNGSYFKLPGGASSATVSKANAEAGYNITITYTPTANGSHTATLTISGCGVTSHEVTLTGTCTTVYNVTWRADDGSNPYHSNTAANGSKPTLPSENPDDCSTSRVFMGWTDDSDYSGDGSDLFTDSEDAPPITSATTFYAVYADKSTSGGGGTSAFTFAPSDFSGQGTIGNGSAMSATNNGVTLSFDKGYGGDQIRTYAGGTFTFTASNAITAITITTNSEKGNAENITLSSGGGTYSGSTTTGTWSGSSTSLTFANASKQVQITAISGTVGSSGSTTYSNYSTQCSACTPVTATASYADPTSTATCGGSVSNTFTTNSNATVSYTSTNTSVATVASDGTVTPVGQGSATITATVPANTCFTGGASASFTLTVKRNTGTASFSGATTTVNKDATVTNVVTTNSDGAVTYSSSNTSVATVNASGVVTGVSAGTATITANVAQSTCYTAASANYTITVYDFKANAATDVTCESFTANWNTSGAASYSLDVYQGTTGSTTVNRDTTWLNNPFTDSQGSWTTSGTSDVWTQNSTYGMKASKKNSDALLISPELDFSDATAISLEFEHTRNLNYGTTAELMLKISTDGGANWTQLAITNWTTTTWTYVTETQNLSAYVGNSSVKIAFEYTSGNSYGTWEIKNLVVSGKYDKTISTSSVEHVSGYPKNVSGTSASVTGLDASTTYKYTVTPLGGSASNEIEVTTPACSCTRTITATTADDSMGTVEVTLP